MSEIKDEDFEGYILTQASICSETCNDVFKDRSPVRLHLNSSQHLL